MLLYSKFLYFLYQQTANVTVGMLIVLSLFGLYNAKKLRDEYKILLYLWIGYSIFELEYSVSRIFDISTFLKCLHQSITY